MRRFIPSPLLSVGLFLLWILLMQSVDAGTVLLGLLMAWVWPFVSARLRPAPVRLRRPGVVLRLWLHVVSDMLQSNARVAWAILTRRSRQMRPGFVRIPLELRDPNGLAALAAIVTFTPGTAWAQLSADNRVLLLHVFDLVDEAPLVAEIKGRYEKALREIFE